MFEPFFLHMYRGVMLTYLHEYKDAFIDFEYALTIGTKMGFHASPANFTAIVICTNTYRHQSPPPPPPMFRLWCKSVFDCKNFVAYNGGVALTLDDQFQHAASWFNIAMNYQSNYYIIMMI